MYCTSERGSNRSSPTQGLCLRKFVVLGNTCVIWVKLVPSNERSILKPASLVDVSVQLRLTWFMETTRASRFRRALGEPRRRRGGIGLAAVSRIATRVIGPDAIPVSVLADRTASLYVVTFAPTAAIWVHAPGAPLLSGARSTRKPVSPLGSPVHERLI